MGRGDGGLVDELEDDLQSVLFLLTIMMTENN